MQHLLEHLQPGLVGERFVLRIQEFVVGILDQQESLDQRFRQPLHAFRPGVSSASHSVQFSILLIKLAQRVLLPSERQERLVGVALEPFVGLLLLDNGHYLSANLLQRLRARRLEFILSNDVE